MIDKQDLPATQSPSVYLRVNALSIISIALALVSMWGSIFVYMDNNKADSVFDQLMLEQGRLQQFSQAEIARYFDIQQEKAVTETLARYSAVQENQPNGKAFYGNPAARFTLVEYSDMECPYCKSFHTTPKKVVDSSQGEINWEWSHMPLDFHNPAAQVQALAAECVREVSGNKAYWAFIDKVFQHTGGNGKGVSDLRATARSVGANNDEFITCISTARHAPLLQQDLEQAQKLGINSTPYTVVVDNQTGNYFPLKGARPAEQLLQIIQQLKDSDSKQEQQ